jgi:hypothetical protein
MSAERVFALLLRAYPRAFRAEYGREMTLVFRDQRREAGGGGVAFWAALLLDVARSAPSARADVLRARRAGLTQSWEGTMRPMAMLAVVVGALEAVWIGITELWAGGIQRGDGVSLAAGALAVVAGVLLATAGLALLRRGTSAVAWARGAAVACLVAFAIIGLAAPRLGIAAMALGILVPVALVVVLQRGRGAGTPTMA